MKKVLLTLTMLLLAFTGTMKAESLTVHDGTTTNGNVPVYGFYADAYNKCEMVYPAAELSAMAGGTINSLTFYASQTSVDWGANFQVFVAEVADATISAFAGPGTVVYEGQLSIADGEMVVTFDTPYTYGGGNLLVGFYQTSTGSYITSTWYGENVTGASGSGYDYSGLSGCNFGQKNFLPKTTFDYTVGGGGGGELVEVTIGDPTSTTTNSYLPGYTLYDYAISQQIYTADEIGVAGTINTLTVWLKNTSSYARNINVYMKEVEATEFASNTAWESFAAADMVVSFTMPNGIDTPIEVALPLNTPFEYSGNSSLVICFQDVTGQWSSGLGGVEMDATGNQALYAYRDGTVYDPSNVGVNGTLLAKKNVIRLSIMTSGDEPTTAFTTIPDVLDLGYRPNGAWMAPYVFNLKSNVGAVTVNALDFSGNYFTYNAELPATVSGSNPLEVAVSTGTAEAGEVNSTITVLYSGNDRDAEQLEITATAYDPVEGDVFEMAVEVPAMEIQTPYEDEFPQGMYKNYDLPFETEKADAVYELTFANDVLLYAAADSGNVVLYTEDFNGEDGPMADNNYEYNGPQINPGPVTLWFSYPYTGTNTWYGTSAGGGFYFGYKISTDVIAANDLAGLTITTVEAAAREAYPYYCYIIEGGATPDDGELIGYGAILNPTALYFFDINLEEPAYISGNEDIWVIFYSDSPYAAYCGRYPVSTANGKIWTYNPNATTPMWSSNVSYTPVIYARMLELPTGREVTMDLASMTMPKGNGTVSEIAEAEGEVKNVAKAQLRNRNEVVIGDGTGTTYYFPIDNYFNYSVTEQIYTAAEIGTAGTINAVSFYYNYGTAYTANNVTMYMKNVARSEFASTADCEPLSASDVVWSGAIAPTEAGWYTFTLNTPFEYDGTSNLLVAFYDGTSGYPGTSYTWSQTSTGDTYMALRYYSDSSNPDPYNLASYTGSKSWYNYRGNIKIDITPGGGGDEPGGDEPWAPDFEAQINGMYVPAGTYYLVAAANEGNVNIAIDNVPAPEQPVIIYPEAGELVEYPYLAEWILGDYTEEFQVLCGTQYPPTTVMIDWTDHLVETAFLPELEKNKNYFMQVNARNAAGTTSSEIVGFHTPIDPVEGFAVVNDSLYPGDAAEFSWEANSRTLIGYNLYKDGELVNVEGPITGTEYAVEDLEYNMDGYAFQITAVYGAGESVKSDPIIVKMTGTGTISGHVYDAPDYDPEDPDQSHPVANLPVFIIVSDEYNQVQEYEVFTDEDGFYTAEILAGMAIPGISQVTAEAYGYAVAVYRDPVTGMPFMTVAYDGEYEDIDIYTHEYYYPLGMITATEQTDENNVLVEWDWNPAELVVDFETGDFSQAEFTLPAQYAWAVTTTNPHEGTYCMKSTCEGIASATSSIEVTVDVPYDGLMGFWVRVSSESNYDKFHFYIDGVEQGAAMSGQLAYQYKEYAVTAGTHTYKWEYTKDSSVNSNDDCVYVDDIKLFCQPAPPIPGATVYDFEDQTMMGWTSLDANNDGYGWVSSANPGQYHNAGVTLAGSGHNASQGFVLSGSYSNSAGIAITPDNYLVSPTQISVEDGALISFYACAQDASYAAEHFGVAVSTGSATAANFTMVQEWTMTAKGIAPAEDSKMRGGNRAQGNWYEYSVDLSSYAGQDIWVAIRHFNCNDQFILNVDDITLADGSAKQMARNERTFQSFNLYRRDIKNGENDAEVELIATPAADVFSYIDNEWNELGYGMWQWGIQATYEGYAVEETGDRTEYTYDFEGGLNGWTGIVVNTDGGEWIHSNNNLGGYDYTTLAHGGTGFAMCYSYVDYDGPYDTDALLVSPQSYSMDANSNIHFYADNANDSYPENFSVWVSTAANPTSASDFTQVWSGGAKGTGSNGAVVRHADNRYENWREHTIDLSAYAGQTIWIAFRDVNYDAYEIWIDDVTITAGSSSPTPGPTPTPTPTGSGLSEILWSNVIDKDMIADVTVNVTLNNAQLPVGAVVTFADTINDQNYTATTDATGIVNFDNFRKGNYIFNVALEGYELAENFEHDVTIDEDEMTFDVVLYEIIAPVANLYVSPTGWAMWEGGTAGGGTTPTPGPTPGVSVTYGFEADEEGWTSIDADGDGYEWYNLNPSNNPNNIPGHNNSVGHMTSASYQSVALTPNNYLVSPEKGAYTQINFWACGQDASWAAEHFGVAVSTTGNTSASDFTTIQEWTMTAKGSGVASVGRDGQTRDQGTWYEYSVDLSAYAGQEIWVAIRHFGCTDMFRLNVDDITLTTAGTKGDRVAMSYKVKLDGKYEGETVNPYFQHNVDNLVEGTEHTTEVCAVYATGVSDWAEYTWTYSECSNYAGTASHSVTAEDNDVTVTWTLGGQPGPGPTPPTPTPGTTYDFESGMQGWTNIDADGDGNVWAEGTDTGHNSTGYVTSESYINYVGALTPDNYLVSPEKAAYGQISFWANAQDASYPAEHFGVAVSTTGNTNAADFTLVQEWTMTAKGTGAMGIGRDGQTRAQGTWHEYTVDLSAYAGQQIWVAIRHFNCTDMFRLNVDDVTLGGTAKSTRTVVYEPHFVTDPGAMSNGADASWTKNGQGTWGPNCNNGGNYKLADDFTLDAATTITEIEVYGYQTGSTTTSTFTGLFAQIYDGAPNAGGQVVWGDAAANIMTSTSFTNCYRGSDGETTATTRPIMAITAENLNIQLAAGTYYLVWSLAGSASSGPWAAPEALPSVGNTGNGLQYGSSGWVNLTDGGAGTPYGGAFKLVGEGGGPTPGPTPSGDVLGVYVFRDGELVSGETPLTTTTFVDNDVEAGEHDYCVRVVYSDYAMSCEECETVEIGEVSCDPVTNLTAELYNYQGNDGALVDWTAPAGVVSYKIYVNGTLLGSLASNPVFINFMGLADDVYEIGVVAVYAECESEMATVSFTWDAVAENEIVNNIYPNPTSGNVTIEATGMNHITVANALGQVVYDADVNADQIELNLGQYNNGLYLVRISTVNGVSVKRVTVAK